MHKKVLITGGSGGIGKQTAIALATAGFEVIITGRSERSCTEAVLEIKAKSDNAAIDYMVATINSLKSVQTLAHDYFNRHGSLDILINNTGILKEEREITADGIEQNFAVNAMAPYLLSNLLLPLLKQSPEGRIITLSGGMHPKKLALQNLQAEKGYTGIVAYSHSKLTMMALMYAFGKQVADTTVKVAVCYPGQASTAMTQAMTPSMFPGLFRFLFPLF